MELSWLIKNYIIILHRSSSQKRLIECKELIIAFKNNTSTKSIISDKLNNQITYFFSFKFEP